MMPARLVVDTDIVINVLKKRDDTVARFLELVASNTVVLVSPVVVAKIYAGAFESEHKDIEGFFKLCQRIDIDHDTARAAGLYARQFGKAFQGISLKDYLLAAAAKAHRCPLWTGNREHYPMEDIALFDA